MGSRYGGLKQIDAVGPSGETLLDYSIHDALRAGFGKLVFVIRRDFAEEFRERVGARYESRVAVEYVYQELDNLPNGLTPPPDRTKPWGTGHAILIAGETVREPFGVINADDFYGRDAFVKLADFLATPRPANQHGLVVYPLRNTLSDHGTVSRGICRIDGDGLLSGVEEVTAIAKEGSGASADDRTFTGDERVSMNLWGFQPEIFSALTTQFREFLTAQGQELKSEFFIPFVVDEEIRRNRCEVRALETDSQWTGVTYRDDKPKVESFIRQLVSEGVYPESLQQQEVS